MLGVRGHRAKWYDRRGYRSDYNNKCLSFFKRWRLFTSKNRSSRIWVGTSQYSWTFQKEKRHRRVSEISCSGQTRIGIIATRKKICVPTWTGLLGFFLPLLVPISVYWPRSPHRPARQAHTLWFIIVVLYIIISWLLLYILLYYILLLYALCAALRL